MRLSGGATRRKSAGRWVRLWTCWLSVSLCESTTCRDDRYQSAGSGFGKGNAQRNGIEQVDIHQSNIYAQLNQPAYAAILAIHHSGRKEVVHEILTGAFPLLKAGGTLTIVIQKKQGAPSAQKKMQETWQCRNHQKDKGYYIIQSVKKRSCSLILNRSKASPRQALVSGN